MTLSIMKPIVLAAFLTAGTAFAQPVASPAAAPIDDSLAAATLFEGDNVRAIAMLRAQLEEYPGDPALLINLGIAYAQGGKDAEARVNFENALTGREVIELETANGTTTDSRRLARRALAMLDRGDFGPANMRNDARAGQLSLNQ